MLTVLADCLGLVDIDRLWTCGLLFLLGAVALLWTTRHLRLLGLVYVGLGHFVLGVMVLSSWAITASNPGIQTGYLALTAAATAFVLWATGATARRSGLSEFYTRPCLETSFAVTIGVFSLGLGARLLTRDAYQLATLALGANTVVTMLVAASCAGPS